MCFGGLGGARINNYAQQGLIQDLSEFWKLNPNKGLFPEKALSPGRYGDKLYGLPISTNVFTLYYRKSVFKKLNIEAPTTWRQTIDTCIKLREQDINMFALGTKNSQWILHGWFDYLNLRLHGLEFHQKVMSGQQSFLDKRIRVTFEHFKELIDNQCFNQKHEEHDTWDVFPSILRGYSAMILAAAIPTQIQFAKIDDLGVAIFPELNSAIPNYTVAPVDVLVVPYYAKMTAELNTLLTYFSTAEFQEAYVHYQQFLTALDSKNKCIT